LPLGGTATGRLTYAASTDASPRASIRLAIDRFTRQSGVLARPVDMAVVGRLADGRAAVRAGLSRGGQMLGRFEARLPRLPALTAADPTGAILATPVRANLDYEGPAEAVWPLAGIEAISVNGPILLDVDIAGLVGEPRLTGTLSSDALAFESVASGTRIEQIDLAGRFTGSQLILERFQGSDPAGGGISGSGTVDLSLARGFPIDLSLLADNAALIDIDTLDTRVSGPIRIANSPEAGARIAGDLDVERARFQPGATRAEQVPGLNVKEVNAQLVRARIPPPVATPWRLDVGVTANNRIFVRGLGLDSEWSTALRLGGDVSTPRLTGRADLIRGEYDFAGRRFELARGEVLFGGDFPPDPALNIDANARVEGLTATISIRGLASQPEISLSSIPALPEDEILARVLFGTSITALSAPEAVQLAGAVAALQNGGSSVLDPIGSVRRAIGVDRLRIEGTERDGARGTGIAAGEYLGRRTYVEVSTDTEGVAATQVEFALTRAFAILGRVSSFGGSSLGVRISTDY
ncbi:MAG: translocation/assembly module TamB domain-containing protein, partial [Pseudomonadota bacterium]